LKSESLQSHSFFWGLESPFFFKERTETLTLVKREGYFYSKAIYQLTNILMFGPKIRKGV